MAMGETVRGGVLPERQMKLEKGTTFLSTLSTYRVILGEVNLPNPPKEEVREKGDGKNQARRTANVLELFLRMGCFWSYMEDC